MHIGYVINNVLANNKNIIFKNLMDILQYKISSKNGMINILEGKRFNNPKAIILNVHGLGSHFQFVYPNLDELKYRDDFFCMFNYKTFGFEFYGHGKSDGPKCLINNFDSLVDNLEDVISYLFNKYKLKIYILAESLGGAVVLKHLIKSNDEKIIGVILLSPMCGIDEHLKPNPIIIKSLIGISKLFPQLKLALTTKNLSQESVINQDYINAKNDCTYSYKGSHRLATVREIYNTSLWIPENSHKIDKPLLIFHGLHDKITTPQGSQKVFDIIKTKDKEIIMLPESEHSLLVPNDSYDLTPNFIYSKILGWLENH